jgi:hypothetical protein
MQDFAEFCDTPDHLDCPVVGPPIALLPDLTEEMLVPQARTSVIMEQPRCHLDDHRDTSPGAPDDEVSV